MSLLKLSSSIIDVEHSKRGYNVTLTGQKFVLFFSQEHCINYKIKTYQQAVIIHSALIIYIVANDNTQLLQYSVGHCNSRLDSCWCFCIFMAHNHRLNVATRSKPKNG